MSGISIPVLASSVFFTAFAAFGAGYMMSPAPVRSSDDRPIVDPEAWNRADTAPPAFESKATAAQADAAMQAEEASLRGWSEPDAVDLDTAVIEPTYQDEVRPLDVSGQSGSYAVEPLDGVGGEADQGTATIVVLDKAEADRAWDDWPTSAAPTPQSTQATTISAPR